MSVILKQRTYRTKEGKAVGHGDLNAAFLIGAEGQRITDDTAVSLGLIDGKLSSSVSKERREKYDKETKKGEDKTGRRIPDRGRPVNAPKEGTKKERIRETIEGMVTEATADPTKGKDFFTEGGEGKPDAQVISSRMEERVTAAERDEVCDIMEKEWEKEQADKATAGVEKADKEKDDKTSKK